MIILFIILSATTIVFGFLFFLTNQKLRKLIRSLQSNQRVGYYDMITSGYGSYSARIYVAEVERYTNGKSKIKFLRMENIDPSYVYGYSKLAENFKCPELRDTNLIDWLIVEEDIKQQRLKKLKELGL